MDGASGAGPSRSTQSKQGIKTPKKERGSGRSFYKHVQLTVPEPHLPRDTYFRPSNMVSDFRYRAAALPPQELSLADSDDLDNGQQRFLEILRDTLDDDRTRIALIACDHPTHNQLVLAARQIELDLQSGKPKKVERAKRFTACIDEVCQESNFPWRNKGLSPDYYGLRSAPNQKKVQTLFKDDIDEQAFQSTYKHIFFPPWTEKKLGELSLARVYELYWEVRQRLGSEEVASPFDKEDFVALFPELRQWLKDFPQMAKDQTEFTSDQIEAFKYLLDRCDTPPNSLSNKPKWTWRSLANVTIDPEYKPSQTLINLVNKDDRLRDLSGHITLERPGDEVRNEPPHTTDSSVFSPKDQFLSLEPALSMETEIPIPEFVEEVSVFTIPFERTDRTDRKRSHSPSPLDGLSESKQPKIDTDDSSTKIPDPEATYTYQASIDSDDEVPLTNDLSAANRSARDTTSSLESKEDISGSPFIPEINSQLPAASLEKDVKIRLMSLDRERRLKLKHNQPLNRYCQQTVNSFFTEEQKEQRLSPYELMALPMDCLKEVLKDFKLMQEGKSKDIRTLRTTNANPNKTISSWLKPRLKAVQSAITVVQGELADIRGEVKGKFESMMDTASTSSDYQQLNTNLDKIEAQYMKYYGAIEQCIYSSESEDRASQLRQLEQLMDYPVALAVKPFYSAERWEAVKELHFFHSNL